MNLATQTIANTDYRSTARTDIGRDGTIRDAAGSPVEVTVQDVSLSGCLLLIPTPIPEDYVLNIGLPGLGRREGRIVWREGDRHGVEFLWPLSAAELKDVGTTENLILGAFPQRLDMLLTPDGAAAPRRHLSRRGLAFIAGASALCWAGIGYAAVSLIG